MPNPDQSFASVFYDADCQFCVNTVRRFASVLARRRFELLPLQTPGASAEFGVSDDQLLAEMRLRLRDGTVFGGAAAVVEIARRIWWAWPLWALSRLPGAMRPMDAAYRWIARRRNCANGACAIEAGPVSRRSEAVPASLAFLPVAILPVLALLGASRMPRWVFMWAMASALYAGCKWLTYSQARGRGVPTGRRRALAYLLAWPGMDASAFLGETARHDRPQPSEWMAAALRTLSGATLVWVVARTAVPVHPLLAGWIAMVGLIFLFHFGTFHLLSLAWRSVGVNAMPVMQNPLRSHSLAEFWGRRWNTAFHELAARFTFRPLRPIVGRAGATLLLFLVSGLIHELVISLPAHGGYGLPTGYFVLQGLGLAGERTRLGRRVGLGRGWRGRLFIIIVAAAPAFWLFHPPFVRNVILPMLAFIGAT
ncbi:MAG: DCC1-like thiol-disulfide oxidoreductase family protein [Acidobacteriota bacterium]